MHIAPDYPAREWPDLAELEASDSTVIGLRPDLSIGLINSAWTRFATDNDADGLLATADWVDQRRPIIGAIAEPLRAYYVSLFKGALADGDVRLHDYECSTSQIYRAFRLRVMPRDGALLLIHHQLVGRPHDGRHEHEPLESRYRTDHGIIVQCCHCRTVRRAGTQTWDWVPGFVDRMPDRVSHGLCAPCMEHYYGAAMADR